MTDWTYTIKVCPFDGAQVREEGGWDGTELVFACEHSSWMEEYGSIEPIEVPATPEPGLEFRLDESRRELERQRLEKAEQDAENRRRTAALYAAMSPEERERSMLLKRTFDAEIREQMEEMSVLMRRQMYGDK